MWVEVNWISLLVWEADMGRGGRKGPFALDMLSENVTR